MSDKFINQQGLEQVKYYIDSRGIIVPGDIVYDSESNQIHITIADEYVSSITGYNCMFIHALYVGRKEIDKSAWTNGILINNELFVPPDSSMYLASPIVLTDSILIICINNSHGYFTYLPRYPDMQELVDLAHSDVMSLIDSENIQTSGNWIYRVYRDGSFEAWYKATGQTLTINAQSGNLYRSELKTLTVPTQISSLGTVNIQHVDINTAHNNYPCWGMLASLATNGFNYYAMSGASRSSSPNYTITAHVMGTVG